MKYFKRAIRAELEEYLKYFPVLLISGVRQDCILWWRGLSQVR